MELININKQATMASHFHNLPPIMFFFPNPNNTSISISQFFI
jgi:hypothetical protein